MIGLDLEMAMVYLEFVEERHRIYERRRSGEPGPWTEDPILASKKFTNVFRILDPGTQFLMTDLFEPGLTPEDTLMRAFLYRHTGSIDAWRYVREELGEYPNLYNLFDVLACWQEYRQEYQKPVFTGAYLVYPQSSDKGTDKVESIVSLTARLFSGDLVETFLRQPHPAGKFSVLRGNRGVADFMSMQVLTDWGYSQYGEDREDEYVVLGPGARRGAKALAPSADVNDTLRWAVKAIRASPDCPVLWHPENVHLSRVPSYMDTQNTLCEFSKLVRFMAKPTSAKPYNPAHPGHQPDPVLPKHWS